MAFSLLRISVRQTVSGFEGRFASTLIKNKTRTVKCNKSSCQLVDVKQQTNLPSARLLNRMVRPAPLSNIVRAFASKRDRPEKKLAYHSDSDSDSDGEHFRRGESQFWRRKMRTVHRILDVNKDGVISFDDFKLMADRFVALGHLSKQCEVEFYDTIQKLWEQLWGEISPYNLVTVEQYLEDMYHVVNDEDRRDKVHLFLPYLFKAVDINKSGQISVEEFKLFFQCLGLTPESAVSTFTVIDKNEDGLLSIEEFVQLGREFMLNEDVNNVSQMFWGPLVDH